jgi:hypothetical protein
MVVMNNADIFFATIYGKQSLKEIVGNSVFLLVNGRISWPLKLAI